MEKLLKKVIKKGSATTTEKEQVELYAAEYGVVVRKDSKCQNCYVDACIEILNKYKKATVKDGAPQFREPFATDGVRIGGEYYAQGNLTKEKYDKLCKIGLQKLFVK